VERVANDVDDGAGFQAFVLQEGHRHVAGFGYGAALEVKAAMGAACAILSAVFADPQGILQIAAAKDLFVTARNAQSREQLGRVNGSGPARANDEILKVGTCTFHHGVSPCFADITKAANSEQDWNGPFSLIW